MIQFVVGAAAGYVLGTKAGRRRFHQIKGAYEATLNSPITKKAVTATRKAVANKLDPEPRMREIKDTSNNGRFLGKRGGTGGVSPDRIYEPDQD